MQGAKRILKLVDCELHQYYYTISFEQVPFCSHLLRLSYIPSSVRDPVWREELIDFPPVLLLVLLFSYSVRAWPITVIFNLLNIGITQG